MTGTEQFCEQIMQRMDLTKETEDEELREIIRDVLEEACRREYIPLSEKIRISRELFNAFRKLDILQDLIEDDTITEIMVNGTENIFYEREGRIFRSERRFLSESRLADVIQQIVGETNRYVNESSPIVDARLKDGSRVNVVLKPAAVNGPILTIRKFPKNAVTMEQLIRMGSLTESCLVLCCISDEIRITLLHETHGFEPGIISRVYWYQKNLLELKGQYSNNT